MTDNNIIAIDDNNIESIRKKYPDGLHFVVGDTHKEIATLLHLIEKIKFDSTKDHVYFVGDYNDFCKNKHLDELMKYISEFYQADYDKPGFHLIRGNHEREYDPTYPLENISDIIVIRGKLLNFFIAHSGMLEEAFELITKDMHKNPDKTIFAYSLSDITTKKGGILRRIVHGAKGFYSYSTKADRHWPNYDRLCREKACIIHGHVPYFKFFENNKYPYGNERLFWENQKIWFSQDLHSFDIDAGIKNTSKEYERNLSCICLESLDEIAKNSDGELTIENIKCSSNFVFSQKYVDCNTVNLSEFSNLTLDNLLNAKPESKTITIDNNGKIILI